MTRKRHIVIVDDEANIGRSLRLILEGEGYRVSVFESATAFAAARSHAVADVYLLDVRLPDGSGIDLLRLVRQWDERSPAVMISGHGTVADAVQATRIGAFDFLEKPLARDRVLLVVKNALEWSDLQRENQRYRELVGDAPRMIGSRQHSRRPCGRRRRSRAPMSRSCCRRVRHGQGVAGCPHPPRESVCRRSVREGQLRRNPDRVDRERAVRAREGRVHRRGGAPPGQVRARRRRHDLSRRGRGLARSVAGEAAPRAAGRRVPACGRRADDQGDRPRHLGDEPPARRARLDRPVQGGSVLSTERRADSRAGTARAPAGHRWARGVLPFRVLRAEQLPAAPIDPDAVALLHRYTWPGNIRELRNVVERMAILTTGDRITAEAIPLEVRSIAASRPVPGLQGVRDSAERERIRQALDQTDWNVAAAARLLETERTALHKRIRTLGLKRH